MGSVKWLSLILLLVFSKLSFGQFEISGLVKDSITGEPLAFVQVTADDDILKSTETNIDGGFTIKSKSQVSFLEYSYTWYKPKRVEVKDLRSKHLTIRLCPISDQLGTVTIEPTDNPAHRIIRKVIENKSRNNPVALEAYSYESYNKVTYDMRTRDSLVTLKLDTMLRGGHFMLMESVAEKKYMAPGLEQEEIIANKVSGFDSPLFAPLATDLQPFSFYDEEIPILDATYLNPIANGSIRKYLFIIQDTIISGSDSTFIISFQPRKGKNIDGLKGLLYINTNGFAIQNVIASPFEVGTIDVKIQQKYELHDGFWFPSQLNFELELMQIKDSHVGVRSDGRSYIRKVKINPELSKKDFGPVITSLTDESNSRSDEFWERARTNQLDSLDRLTYVVIDSLSKELKLERLVDLSSGLVTGKLPMGPIDVDVTKLFVQNAYEGYRPGIGLNTNSKFIKWLELGGHIGYGFKDKETKYGFGFRVNFAKHRDHFFEANYFNTLSELGKSSLSDYETTFGIRDFLASKMIRRQGFEGKFGFRVFKHFKIDFGLTNFWQNALFEYSFSDNQWPMNFNNISEAHMAVRFVFREKLVNMLGQRISMGSDYPTILLRADYSDPQLTQGAYSYVRYQAIFDGKKRIRNLGTSALRVEAGYIDNILPATLLFTGEGGFAKGKAVVVKNHFQTIAPYEFLSDQYVNIHFSHNFGSLLLKGKKFKPEFTVHQKAGWGSLRNPEVHEGLQFQTKEKGIYEAGLQIDNLIRFRYFNVGFIGLGVAAFYRYGPYSAPDPLDNAAFKVSFLYTSK